MNVEKLLSPLVDQEIIAVGSSIRELPAIKKLYGEARWRKMKGVAKVLADDGRVGRAEVHWYTAHGIGRRKMKVKQFLEPPV